MRKTYKGYPVRVDEALGRATAPLNERQRAWLVAYKALSLGDQMRVDRACQNLTVKVAGGMGELAAVEVVGELALFLAKRSPKPIEKEGRCGEDGRGGEEDGRGSDAADHCRSNCGGSHGGHEEEGRVRWS